jgi:hypothetical protein
MTTAHIKVHLMNTRQIGTRYGYGEGKTHGEAVSDALRQARKIDSDAKFSEQSRCVEFNGGAVCI